MVCFSFVDYFLFSVQISGCMPIFNRIESLILGGPPFFCCLISSVATSQTDRHDRER